MTESAFSAYSLSSAFQSVKENHGGAGVDGVTIESFEAELDNNLRRLRDELVGQTFFPLPLSSNLRPDEEGIETHQNPKHSHFSLEF